MTGQPKWMTITGWILSLLLLLPFGAGGVMKIMENPEMVKGFKEQGFPDGVLRVIGIVEVTCLVIYLVPQTAVLGAVLLTGYMGGAICTHVRMGEGFLPHIAIGIVIWLGIFFREPRLRAILPLR